MLETFLDVADLFHLLLILVVTLVGESNSSVFFYLSKPCQVPLLTERKPQRLQINISQ